MNDTAVAIEKATAPDFEQIADRIVGRIDARARGGGNDVNEIAWVAEQLRQVWNARGAADIAKLEIAMETAFTTDVFPYMKTIDRALRSLDR